VDIEEHLARHSKSIDFVVRQELAKHKMSQYGNPDDFDEARQAVVELMIKRHEDGAYNHSFTLRAYVQPGLKGVISEALNLSRHFNDGKDANGNAVIVKVIPPTDIDEEGIPSLESLEADGKVTPVNWHGSGYGELSSTLTDEDQELAEKLLANLSAKELEVLDASVGRSIHRAAEYMELPYATYYRRLRDAKARAKAVLCS
jgi:hypothetical protein